jgi:hypothetical protein
MAMILPHWVASPPKPRLVRILEADVQDSVLPCFTMSRAACGDGEVPADVFARFLAV